jgi:Ca2+-binding RTX toxin-like protein
VRVSVAFRFSAALIVAACAAAGLAGVAGAATCSLNVDVVEASFDVAGESAALEVTGGGAIHFDGSPCGAATNANTDTIVVTGLVGSTEHLIIDQFNGDLAPGVTDETEVGTPKQSEIEVVVELGDASDEVIVRGSATEQVLVAGHRGVSFNGDSDVDITFDPLPGSLELVGADGGPRLLNVRGGFGSGHLFPGPVTLRGGDGDDSLTGSNFADLLFGGAGDDLVHGSQGADAIDGGAGNDRLRGADGDDSIAGGAGADIFNGSYGNDVFDAHDGVADLTLNGGPGVDSAAFDRGLDPPPVAVENRFPLDPPPPPGPDPDPVTECSFAAGEVSATIAPGDRATLKVVSGQIRFGAPAIPCGGATTANTNEIVVEGPTDTREILVIDLSGGKLAPGATPDAAGRSEIEVHVDLHDVVDLVRVVGSDAGNSYTVGTNGISLNRDNDADVTVTPDPIMVALSGRNGRDRLSAAGGFGSGARFVGVAELSGGASADTLVGGRARDTMLGGKGRDLLKAVDNRRDRKLNGGSGRDTVYFDRGRDRPVNCEVLRPRPRRR